MVTYLARERDHGFCLFENARLIGRPRQIRAGWYLRTRASAGFPSWARMNRRLPSPLPFALNALPTDASQEEWERGMVILRRAMANRAALVGRERERGRGRGRAQGEAELDSIGKLG